GERPLLGQAAAWVNIRSGAPAFVPPAPGGPVVNPAEHCPSVSWLWCSPVIGWRALKLHGVSVSQKVHGVGSGPPGLVQPLDPVGHLLRPALGLARFPR